MPSDDLLSVETEMKLPGSGDPAPGQPFIALSGPAQVIMRRMTAKHHDTLTRRATNQRYARSDCTLESINQTSRHLYSNKGRAYLGSRTKARLLPLRPPKLQVVQVASFLIDGVEVNLPQPARLILQAPSDRVQNCRFTLVFPTLDVAVNADMWIALTYSSSVNGDTVIQAENSSYQPVELSVAIENQVSVLATLAGGIIVGSFQPADLQVELADEEATANAGMDIQSFDAGLINIFATLQIETQRNDLTQSASAYVAYWFEE